MAPPVIFLVSFKYYLPILRGEFLNAIIPIQFLDIIDVFAKILLFLDHRTHHIPLNLTLLIPFHHSFRPVQGDSTSFTESIFALT